MAVRKNGEKQRYWQKLIRRQASSGLSVRQFCGQEGVSEPSFYAWRKRLRERKNGGGPRGKSGQAKNEPDNGHLFVPLKLLDATQTLEIIHPLGYRLQVTGDVDPVALRQVIEVLDERGGR